MSPRPTAKSAASPAALGFPVDGPVAARPRMTASATGDSASGEALNRLDQAVRELKALSIEPLLQNAIAAIRAEDARAAGDWAIKALEIDERSGFGWYLLAIAREKAGDFASAIRAYESALSLIPDHGAVANDLGRLAYRLGMVDTAEKLFAHFLAAHPGSHEGANNLACAIRDQGRFEDAIEVVRPAILANPDNALLWNTLGSIVAEQGDPAGSITFFDEALRLDPGFAKARYNRGNARLPLGEVDEAFEDCETALTSPLAEDERQMMLLARSTIRMARGEIAAGWDDYEARLHPRFADVTHFAIDAPRWTPQDDLAGRTMLLVGEQGLGDEVMFANAVPDLIRALGPDGRLLIAVEPRLVPLFQRSFPTAEVGAHVTGKVDGHTVRGAPFVGDHGRLDLWAPMASILRRFRPTARAFPTDVGFLVPDPMRVAHWLEQLPAGPRVGLLWKSAVSVGARHRFFSPFDLWRPVLETPGVTFVNLQYGDCESELDLARRDLGVEIWQPPGVDLKQDLDEVAALCGAMDLVIGFANATFNIAAACGAPAWLATTPGAWPRLGTDRYPWYPQARCFWPLRFSDWAPMMDEIAGSLAAKFGR
ncbi:MAG: tetratricopeptide repeat protein [Pseudomonadota bacterium]